MPRATAQPSASGLYLDRLVRQEAAADLERRCQVENL